MQHILNDADILSIIGSHASFHVLKSMPQVCKATHSALDWRSLQEGRVNRFPIGSATFVVYGSGWMNQMSTITLIRKNANSKMLQTSFGSRRKIHFCLALGGEFVCYDPTNFGHKSRRVFPKNVYDEGTHRHEIESNNVYWHLNS